MMATNSLNQLRLLLRRDGLPIGMAIVKRVWSSGPKNVIQLFTELENPVDQLRQEGNEAAQLVLNRLDNIQSDVTSPFTVVEISEKQEVNDFSTPSSKVQLLEILLTQIDKDLVSLNKYIELS